MADHSKIEWTDATWTPVKGCTRVSPGCGGPGKAGGCYAEIMAARFSKPGQWGEGLAEIVTLLDGSKDHRWTGVVRFDEAELLKPLRWKRSRKIFVCSTADLFHEKVEDEWIDRVFAVMALCPQHIFQVLTKRPERMRDYLSVEGRYAAIYQALWNDDKIEASCLGTGVIRGWKGKASPAVDNINHLAEHGFLLNVWLGTSAEDQQRADERIPHLLATPAAVRFLSAEPLLGALDVSGIVVGSQVYEALRGVTYNPMEPPHYGDVETPTGKLDWVICGGESGPGARPMHPDWARSLRDQCAADGVPFFFKQWGTWAPLSAALPVFDGAPVTAWPDGTLGHGNARDRGGPGTALFRGTKAITGRLLDGVTHDGMPA